MKYLILLLTLTLSGCFYSDYKDMTKEEQSEYRDEKRQELKDAKDKLNEIIKDIEVLTEAVVETQEN